MALRTKANHENELEAGILKRHQADNGRAILARCDPEYEYDLDVDGQNELLPLS